MAKPILTLTQLCKSFADGATSGQDRWGLLRIGGNTMYSLDWRTARWRQIAVRCVNSDGETFFKVSNRAHFMGGKCYTMQMSFHISWIIGRCRPYVIVDGWATHKKEAVHSHKRISGVVRKWSTIWSDHFPLSCAQGLRTENGVLYDGDKVLAVKHKCRSHEYVPSSNVKYKYQSLEKIEVDRWDENLCPTCTDRFSCWTERETYRTVAILSEEPTGNSQPAKALKKWCQPYVVQEGIKDEHRYGKKDSQK